MHIQKSAIPLRHIDALDGVRAISVLLVVAFHLGLAPIGWIGVQVFFVLSGFLITGILVKAKDQQLTYYLARFYWRRSLRIFPLYFVFLVIAAVSFGSFWQDWPWLLTYTANFARLRTTDLSEPFVHLWSLAVEEQFYLIWPFVVFFLNTSRLRQLAISIVIAAPIGRLLIYLAFDTASPDWLGRTIYSLPTSQADAFAVGAILSLTPIHRPRRVFIASALIMAAAGTAVILHQHFAYHAAMKLSFGYAMFLLQDGGFVWGYTIINVTAAAGLAWVITESPKLLRIKPILRIGVVSYGIYVYHLPLLIAFETVGPVRGTMLPLYLCAVYAVAEISYRFLESPFLRLKNRFGGGSVVAFGDDR